MHESKAPETSDDLTVADALLFDVAPVSMWIEDGSGLLQRFNAWRAQGITSFKDHVRDHPHLAVECTLAVRVVQVNAKTLRQFEATDLPHLIACLPQIFGDRALADMMGAFDDLWNGQREFSCKTVNYTATGRRMDVQVWGRILPGYEQDWTRFLLVVEDLTELETARRLAATSEAHARRLFHHSPSALLVQDYSRVAQRFAALRAQGVTDLADAMAQEPGLLDECIAAIRVLDVNRRTLELYRCADLPQFRDNVSKFIGGRGRERVRRQFVALWNGQLEQGGEVVSHTLDGALLHLKLAFSVAPGHESDWSLVVVSLEDITESKLANEKLHYLGTHDALTGLYNRAFYSQMLESLVGDAQSLTIIALDVNGLKRLNDRCGHAAGDALIKRAAQVLTESVAEAEAVYPIRIGGDEFVILMLGADAASGLDMGARIRRHLFVDNRRHPEVSISLSMGIATRIADEEVISVVQRADAEMYVDKRGFYQLSGFNRRTGY